MTFLPHGAEPCWAYHNTHALDDLNEAYGVTASDEVVVLFVEGDQTTGYADLMGQTAASQGDWVAGSNYPIIDDNASTDIASAYQISYFPTVYRICPNGLVSEVGSLTASALRSSINNNCGLPAMSGVQNFAKMIDNETGFCTTTGSPVTKMRNYGSNAITSATLNLKENGTVVATKEYVGTATQFTTKNVTFDAVTINPASTYTVELTNVNAQPNTETEFATAAMNLYVAKPTDLNIVVKVYTDNYPTEIKWRIKNSAGFIVASGGHLCWRC
ncbi:hypothetical protein [Flavobacterium sp. 3HN19-14]|uniref:hypothetical protein n=1 Tax=Flavobacterium sp. 3HN19-14 TaxID=3448133 RepID=UPI003EE17FDC